MAFNWGAALGGGALLGGLLGSKGKDVTTSLLDYMTPEQKQSIGILSSLANTGSGGGINLGEAYGGSLGNFDMTNIEQQGLSNLMSLLQGGGDARKVYTEMANTKFNPDDPSSGFAAFSRQVNRAQKNADNAINRNAAISGSRFNSGINKSKQDLQAQTNDSLQSALAQLFNQSQDRKIQGAQGLQSLDNQQLAQAQTFGSLSRDLQNQQAQVNYNEFLRQNQEKLSRIGLMQSTTATPYGSITTQTPSLFQQLLPAIGIIGGALIGGPVGAGIGGSLGNIFSKTGTSSGSPSGNGQLSFGNYGL